MSGDRIGGGTATGTVARSVELYGPGDIIGLDLKALVRTEPRHWVTNFESNYLPFVEFYDEEMPWRYTPAKPSADQRRLRPWLTLAVLKESEFREAANVLGRPLPYIEVLDPGATLPPDDQLWAWAHVHVNGGLGVDPNDTAAVAAKLGETVSADRDLAYSRLLGPRLLEPNVAYHAFLVPSFESGRLAGLGDDPAHAAFATQSAWAEYAGKEEPTLLPFYHRWYFRTGTIGDFEYLVRLLKPRTVDGRVGRRDMDVQRPDANLPGILGLGGILRLGGALRAPLATLSEADLAEYNTFEQWGKPYPHPFQTALASLVNLPEAYGLQSAQDANGASGLGPGVEADDDPLIVPPLYSRWHSETSTLVPAQGDPEQHRWVQELNLDPRHRVSAGFGTERGATEPGKLHGGGVAPGGQSPRRQPAHPLRPAGQAGQPGVACANPHRDAPGLRPADARGVGAGAGPAHGEPGDDQRNDSAERAAPRRGVHHGAANAATAGPRVAAGGLRPDSGAPAICSPG